MLLPHLAGVVVDSIESAGALLRIWARARADGAVCPACGRSSRRVHSRYERRLADAAIGGRRVVIRLQVRRLFCDDPDCVKTTFAEQVPASPPGTRARPRSWPGCCGTSRCACRPAARPYYGC
jgi:transposase